MRELIIYRQFFTKADCYKRKTIQQPKGVQVHSTGANNSYLKRYVQPDDGRLGVNPNNNSHNKSGLDVCANAYIGKLNNGTPAIYQTLPWNYRCWLSGSSTKGNANKLGYIGFEICEDNLQNEDYFRAAVMGLSVNLVAYLCLEYNIPLSNVHDHKELHQMGLASNHADIRHWLTKYNLTMDDYRAEVQAAINEGVKVTYIEGTDQKEEESKKMDALYTAKVIATNNYPVKMREKPSTSGAVLVYVPLDTIVSVYEQTNTDWCKVGYNGATGYMMSQFLRPIVNDTPTLDISIDQDKLSEIKNKLQEVLQLIDSLLNS